ncbi:MAG: hypothetical protein J6A52_04475, partial [Bacilli bacterium]|nr:hypothetical protein [Bacilli bacterium]
EQSMKALEAQLDAIASSSAAIKLGIIGNMVSGGSLGSYVSFDSTYSFNIQAWKEANPIYHANIFGKTACFVVGQVEGAIKFYEGVVDAGLTVGAAVVQGVGCIFGQDWSTNFLSEAAKFDIAGVATGWAYDGLKSKGQYDEGWKNAGFTVGEVVAAYSSTQFLRALSAGGQTAEASLQAGNSSGTAFFNGGVVGVITYGFEHLVGRFFESKIASKFVSKVVSKLTSGTKAANVLTGVGKVVGNVANVITKPAQWTTKGIVAVGSKLTPVTSAVVGKLGQGWNKVQNSKLGQGAKNTWNKVQNSKLGQGAKNAWNKMTNKTTAGGDAAKAALNTGDDAAKAALNTGGDAAKASLNTGGDAAKAALNTGDDAAKAALNTGDDAAKVAIQADDLLDDVSMAEDWMHQNNAFGSDIPSNGPKTPTQTPENNLLKASVDKMDDVSMAEDWMHQNNAFGSDIPSNGPKTPAQTPENNLLKASVDKMDDLASRGVPEPQFEQTNWDMYDPARTPGRTGTEVGYVENGEFVSGYSAPNGQQITAENSMFANASNKQFKGYQHRNGLNKNQLPPV